jgi:hypothetical protein
MRTIEQKLRLQVERRSARFFLDALRETLGLESLTDFDARIKSYRKTHYVTNSQPSEPKQFK